MSKIIRMLWVLSFIGIITAYILYEKGRITLVDEAQWWLFFYFWFVPLAAIIIWLIKALKEK